MADTDTSPTGITDVSDNASDDNQPTTGAFSGKDDDGNAAPDSSQTASQPDGTPSQGAPAAGPAPDPSAKPQQSTDPDGTDGDQNTPSQTALNGPKSPNPAGPAGGPLDNKATDPAIAHAGRFYKFAQTLAGGPRFTEAINPETGNMERKQVPLSRGDLGMAIAMEAISGALSGLAQSGPGATGRAAAAGYAQVSQEQQAAKQEQDRSANADFARHAQVFETNLKTYQIAQTLGGKDYDQNIETAAQYKPLADMIQKNYPQAVKGVVSEQDLAKYHVTKDTAIMTGNVVPVLDPKTGEQSKGKFGNPLWQHEFMVVDPNLKDGGFLTDEDKKTLAEMGKSGFADSEGKPSNLPESLPLRLSMAINLKNDAAGYRIAKQTQAEFAQTLKESHESGAPILQMPTMKNPQYQSMVDNAAQQFHVPPALARAVANVESNSNASAVSPKGAQGVMQLMPDTAASLGVTDPMDPQQNITAGVKYLGMMLDKFNGDPKLALAAYNAGPGNVKGGAIPNFPETKAYVKTISDMVGLDAPPPAKGEADSSAPVVPDFAASVKADPTLPGVLQKFQPFLNARNGNYATAIGDLGKTDPQGAGKIIALFGGNAAIHHYDDLQNAKSKAITKQATDQEAADHAKLMNPIMAERAGMDATARTTAEIEAKRKAGISVGNGSDSSDNLTHPELGKFITDDNYKTPNGTNDAFLAAMSKTDPERAKLIESYSKGMDIQSYYAAVKKFGGGLAADIHAYDPSFNASDMRLYDKTVQEFGPNGKIGLANKAASTTFKHLNNLHDSIGTGLEAAVGLNGPYKEHLANAISEMGNAYANGHKAGEAELKDQREALSSKLTSVSKPATIAAATDLMEKVKTDYDSYDSVLPKGMQRHGLIDTDGANAFFHLTHQPVDIKLIKAPRGATGVAPDANKVLWYHDAQGHALVQVPGR